MDMVLATLLDDSLQTQPSSQTTEVTTAGTYSSSAANTTSTTAAAATQRPPRTGSQHRADSDDLEDNIREVGAAGVGRVNPITSSGVCQVTPRKTKAVDTSVSFPSGSQFRRTNPNVHTKKYISIAEARHVPLPPQDTEFMEIGPSSPPQRQEGAAAIAPMMVSRTSNQPTPAEIDVDDDVMDALFGEDNLDEVAEHGQIFGFDHRRNHEDTQNGSRQRIQPSERGIACEEYNNLALNDQYYFRSKCWWFQDAEHSLTSQ